MDQLSDTFDGADIGAALRQLHGWTGPFGAGEKRIRSRPAAPGQRVETAQKEQITVHNKANQVSDVANPVCDSGIITTIAQHPPAKQRQVVISREARALAGRLGGLAVSNQREIARLGGLTRGRARREAMEQNQNRAKALLEQGYSRKQVADELRVASRTLRRWLAS